MAPCGCAVRGPEGAQPPLYFSAAAPWLSQRSIEAPATGAETPLTAFSVERPMWSERRAQTAALGGEDGGNADHMEQE